jgi:hypothetical protein
VKCWSGLRQRAMAAKVPWRLREQGALARRRLEVQLRRPGRTSCSRWNGETGPDTSLFAGRIPTRRENQARAEDPRHHCRDRETGRLDRRRVRVAELAVQQFQAKLVVGQPARPTAASANNTPSATQTWPVESPRTGHLILRAGFDLALDPVAREVRVEQNAAYTTRW